MNQNLRTVVVLQNQAVEMRKANPNDLQGCAKTCKAAAGVAAYTLILAARTTLFYHRPLTRHHKSKEAENDKDDKNDKNDKNGALFKYPCRAPRDPHIDADLDAGGEIL